MKKAALRHRTSLLLAAGLLGPAVAAAEPAEERGSAYSETVDVEVVNVDVYVTDRRGAPVTDLAREDFVLLEDGKRVDFDYFYGGGAAAGGGRLAPPAEDRQRGSEWSRAEAAWGEPPHVVVFVDNANIQPGSRNRVIRRLRGFLDRATGDGARVMVVTNDGSPNIRLPFTDDPERIAAALEELEAVSIRGFDRLAERRAILTSIEQLDQSMFQIVADQKASEDAVVGSISQRPDMLESELNAIIGQLRMYAETQLSGIVATIRSLDGFVDLLGSLPGRKAIVHVSDGLAVRPGQEMIYALQDSYQDGMRLARVQFEGPDGPETRSFSDSAVSEVRSLGSEIATYDATPQYREMLARANAGRVSFYTINGAGAGARLMDAQISGGEAATFSNSASGFQSVAASTDQEGIRLMAEATGGMSLSGAGVEAFLDRLMADMTAYYSLGFVPEGPADATYHRLEVRLKRKGLTVRHREGYRRGPAAGVGRSTVSALLLGFEDNRHGLDLRVTRQEHLEEVSLVHMLLEVPIGAVSLLPGEDSHAATGMVYVVSRPADGELSPLRRFPFSFDIPDDQLEEALRGSWGLQMVLRLESGPHEVAVALSEDASGARSIVRTAVDVRSWGDPFRR